ncbi:MAG: hypothetical protein CMM23_11430, partial [Rhodospirillaceae bacterium]|nr:hypothetical protein [Rhodospirillaceae bacterium]
GGDAGSAIAGVAGIAGGAATLDFGGATSTANIALNDGTDGSAGTDSGANAGGAAGAGGVATAAFTAAHTLTGNITAAADNEGVVTTAGGALTVTGSIGSSTADLDQVTIGDAGGLDITGNLYAKDVVLNIAGAQLNFSGTALQTVSAAISAGAGGTEDITFGANAIVTFNSAIGTNSAAADNELVDITTSAGSTVIFKSTVKSATLTLNATGTSTYEDAVTLTGALTAATGTTITLGNGIIAGETVFSHVNGAAFAAGAITVNMPQTFNTGTITLTTETGNAGAAAADIANITFNANTLATYTAAADAGDDDIIVTAAAKSSATIASALGISTDEATALASASQAIATGDATAAAAFNTVLIAGGAAATSMAEQIAVQADTLTAGPSAAVGSGAQVVGVASGRLASLRSDSGKQYASIEELGFSTGEGSAYSKAFWLKPFGNLARQDTHDGVAGFDADTYGLSGGFDAEVSDGVRLGGALAWSNTDVDGAGTGNSQLSIDSYQVTLYGDYTTYSHYIVGSVGYARSDTDSSRSVAFGGVNRIASASYNSNQYMVNIGGGMPMQISDGGTFFTPTAGLAWTRVSSDSYTETGAGNLNLIMNPDDVDVILASVGGQIHTQIKSENGIWTPTARAGVSYDIAGDEATATATYTGGGAAFKVTGAEVAQLGANVGVGATYYQAGWSVGLAYDADFKDDYVGHSAIVQLGVSF